MGCKSDKSEGSSSPVAEQPTDHASYVPPLPALPSLVEGLYCQRGGERFSWPKGGRPERIEALVEAAVDGSLYHATRREKGATIRFVSGPRGALDEDLQPIERQEGMSHADNLVVFDPRSALITRQDRSFSLYDGTRWIDGSLPAAAATESSATDGYESSFRLVGAARLGTSLWIATRDQLFRISADGKPTTIEAPGSADDGPVRYAALAATNDSVYVVVSQLDRATMWSLADGRAPVALDVTIRRPRMGMAADALGDGQSTVAAILQAHGGVRDEGQLFVVRADTEIERLGDDVRSIVHFDRQGRMWWENRAGLVARSPDGDLTLYPASSEAMLAERFVSNQLRCFDVGAGFDELPEPGPPELGELVIRVGGAGAEPFEACPLPDRSSKTPCQDQVPRIAGVLDEAGHWKGEVPIGVYSVALERDGTWFFWDYRRAGQLRCSIKRGEPCELVAVIED
jgi:hypothetical protein